MAEVMHARNRGLYTEPSMMPFGDYLDQWLRNSSRKQRPKTAEHHEYIVCLHVKPKLGYIPLAELRPMDIQSLYNEKMDTGLSSQTVIHIHRTIHQALREAVDSDLLIRNVAERVKPPRLVKPELRSLTVEEVHTLLSAAKGIGYHLPIHLAIYTGVRRSELLGLRWSDIDLSKGELSVKKTVVVSRGQIIIGDPKTKSSMRTISMDSKNVELVRTHQERLRTAPCARPDTLLSQSRICVRTDGQPMKPGGLSKGYKRIAQKCGISGVRFRDLRHTHATMLLDTGVGIHIVCARMGHSSVQVTIDNYGHLLPSSDADAAKTLLNKLT